VFDDDLSEARVGASVWYYAVSVLDVGGLCVTGFFCSSWCSGPPLFGLKIWMRSEVFKVTWHIHMLPLVTFSFILLWKLCFGDFGIGLF